MTPTRPQPPCIVCVCVCVCERVRRWGARRLGRGKIYEGGKDRGIPSLERAEKGGTLPLAPHPECL